jgi:excisionase family DNA binding protein
MTKRMTVREAAHYMRCSTGTVYGLCAAGRLRCSRVGLGRGKILIAEEAVVEFLDGGAGEARLTPPSPRTRPALKNLRLA